MRRWLQSLLIACCAAALLTVAMPLAQGQTTTGSEAISFSGPYTCVLKGGIRQSGGLVLLVADDGKCMANVTNYATGLTGIVQGVFNEHGEFEGQITWIDGKISLMRGTVRKTAKDKIRWTVTESANGKQLSTWTAQLQYLSGQ